MFQVDRNKHSHKGNNGKVLIVGGSEVYAGAPSLVGLAALRTGADLAYILAPRRAADTAKQFIDLITEPLSGDHITKDNYPEIKRWLTKADVLVIGSGLGQNPATKEAVLKIVDKCEIPMVIDADALKALEGHMDLVQGKQAILTPHINEFKLLSGLKTVTPKDVKQFAIQHKVITVVTADKEVQKLVDSGEVSVALAELAGLNVQKRKGGLEKLKKEAIDNKKSETVQKVLDSYRYLLEERDKGTEGLSSENLINFVKESKMLPNINTVTDIYNMISYKTGYIMGVYNAKEIEGNISLKVADGSENFVPIGTNKAVKIEPGEFLVADNGNKVITRWLTKQHESVKIDLYTKNAILCVQGNKDIPQKDVDKTLLEICELMKEYAGAEYKILYPQKK